MAKQVNTLANVAKAALKADATLKGVRDSAEAMVKAGKTAYRDSIIALCKGLGPQTYDDAKAAFAAAHKATGSNKPMMAAQLDANAEMIRGVTNGIVWDDGMSKADYASKAKHTLNGTVKAPRLSAKQKAALATEKALAKAAKEAAKAGKAQPVDAFADLIPAKAGPDPFKGVPAAEVEVIMALLKSDKTLRAQVVARIKTVLDTQAA